MTWISDNKGAGPWEFIKQPDKLHYNEGNLISDHDDPVWATDHLSLLDEPITPTHHPWCGYWHNKGDEPTIAADCGESAIGYTTLQMSCDDSQTLTVENPVGACTYNWAITSGGGNLSSSTGTSVIYTAPSTNAYCLLNPTIQLSCGEEICDSITIAANCWVGVQHAYVKRCGCHYSGFQCPFPPYGRACHSGGWCFHWQEYSCWGEPYGICGYSASHSTQEGCVIEHAAAGGSGTFDQRPFIPGALEGGCCPEELL